MRMFMILISVLVLIAGCLTVTPRPTLDAVAEPYVAAYGAPEQVSRTERAFGSHGHMTVVMYYWWTLGRAVTFETHEDAYYTQYWHVLATYEF